MISYHKLGYLTCDNLLQVVCVWVGGVCVCVGACVGGGVCGSGVREKKQRKGQTEKKKKNRNRAKNEKKKKEEKNSVKKGKNRKTQKKYSEIF